MKIGQPSAKQRSEEKRALSAALKKKGEDEKKRQEVMAEISRINEAEESGAADILRKFEALMMERGTRISDLFRTIDTSGDGLISRKELKQGLRLLSQPCATVVFAQKKALEKEMKQHKLEVKRRAELRRFLARMKEANDCGAATVIERLEAFLRINQMRVADLFKSLDKSGDGALDAAELKDALEAVNLNFTESEIGKLVGYIDKDGGGLLEADELNIAIRQYRRFRWAAQTIDFSLDGRTPLHEEYGSLNDIFYSSSLEDEISLTENDVLVGLKRLRGDDTLESAEFFTRSEMKKVRHAFRRFSNYLVRRGMNIKELFPDRRKTYVSSFTDFLSSCKTDPSVKSGRVGTAADNSTYMNSSLDDGSIFSQSFDGSKSVESMETLGTLATFNTFQSSVPATPLNGTMVDPEFGGAASKVAMNPASFESVAQFLDGGDGEIDMKELENAFRMARRSRQEQQIKMQGVKLMKRLRKLLEFKNMTLDKFVQLMDSATGKSSAGVSIGDGNVTAREFKVGLQKMVQHIDKKHRHLKFTSKEIKKVLRYIDPTGSGNMSASMMKAAFFSDETPAELQKRINLEALEEEQRKLDPSDIVDDFAVDIIVPSKDAITVEDIGLLVESLDETEDGDVDMGELESLFRLSRRNSAQRKLDEKAMKVLRRVKKIMVKLGINSVNEFFRRMDNAGGAMGNGIVSSRELKVGLQSLCRYAKVPGFAENDLVYLIRFLDPSGEGDLTMDEVSFGMKKAEGLHVGDEREDDDGSEREASEAAKNKKKVAGVILKMEDFMKERGMRLSDLFYWLDRSGDGKLGFSELRDGLERLVFGQSTEDKLAAAQLLEKARSKEKEDASIRVAEQKERDARLKLLDDSGAGDVLRTLEVLMKEKGMRIHDVFRLIDESGDGSISRQELIEGLTKLIRPTKGVAASKLAKERRKRKEQEEAKDKKRQMDAFLFKIEEAQRSGADKVIHKLERFMRKRQLKLSDFFATLDRGSDGLITAPELQVALERESLLLEDDEILNLMDYLDTGGDGEVDRKELEDAIRLHRRYQWETKKSVVPVFDYDDIRLLARYFTSPSVTGLLDFDELVSAVEQKNASISLHYPESGPVAEVKVKGDGWADGGIAGSAYKPGRSSPVSPGAKRPGTSQSRDGTGSTRGSTRGQSRMASRAGSALIEMGIEEEDPIPPVPADEEEPGRGTEEQLEVVQRYLEDLYSSAIEAVGCARENEIVNENENDKDKDKDEEAEERRQQVDEEDWENVAVIQPPEYEAPVDKRPLTAPSGAFEFDLAGGQWQSYGGTETLAGRLNGSEEMSEGTYAVELVKKLEEKDRTIEQLVREVERLKREGKGEGSVVSDVTMMTDLK